MAAAAGAGTGPRYSGTPGLAMPAFSRATSARVSPSISVWSRPMLVIAVAIGAHRLVASSRPPRPTSSTASVHLRLCHGQEAQRGGDLEVGQRHAGGKHPLPQRGQRVAVDLVPVEPDALGEAD